MRNFFARFSGQGIHIVELDVHIRRTLHDTETFSFSLLRTIAVHGIFIYDILYLYQCHVAHNM